MDNNQDTIMQNLIGLNHKVTNLEASHIESTRNQKQSHADLLKLIKQNNLEIIENMNGFNTRLENHETKVNT